MQPKIWEYLKEGNLHLQLGPVNVGSSYLTTVYERHLIGCPLVPNLSSEMRLLSERQRLINETMVTSKEPNGLTEEIHQKEPDILRPPLECSSQTTYPSSHIHHHGQWMLFSFQTQLDQSKSKHLQVPLYITRLPRSRSDIQSTLDPETPFG